jgi:hypothetical protein
MYDYIMYDYIMYDYVMYDYIMYDYIMYDYIMYDYIMYDYTMTTVTLCMTIKFTYLVSDIICFILKFNSISTVQYTTLLTYLLIKLIK